MRQRQIDRHSVSLKAAKRIGILFDGTNLEDQIFIDNYCRILRKDGKEVELLAYLDDKIDHNNLIYRYFNKKDLSWYLHPKSSDATRFMNMKFDILLGLHIKPNMALEYIAALSNANFRIGHYEVNNTHCYDFLIEDTGDGDLQKFIGQIDHFLRIFN